MGYFVLLDGEEQIHYCETRAGAEAAARRFFETDPLAHTVMSIDIVDETTDEVVATLTP